LPPTEPTFGRRPDASSHWAGGASGFGAAGGDVGFESWQAFYESDAQSLYAVGALPVAFLGFVAVRGGSPRPGLSQPNSPFVRRYCIAFALLAILDPLATGPLVRALGGPETRAGLVLSVFFVLLGDFRVLWLLLRLSGPRIAGAAVLEAVGWTLVVPTAALLLEAALRAVHPGLPSNTLWLVYELCFTVLALVLRESFLPSRLTHASAQLCRFVRATAGYCALYYALWAISDTLILVFKLDAGWALRVVANQLYYAFYIPLVWLGFFSAGSPALRAPPSSPSSL